MGCIRRTIQRYYSDNLPITTLDLVFTASRAAKKLIMQAASKSSLQELHLAIYAASLNLPGEIFTSENLNTLSLELIMPKYNNSCILEYSLCISSAPAIKCVNLRVLKLFDVHISEEVLHKLLSACKLLEKLKIGCTQVDYFRIEDVPCLRYYDVTRGIRLRKHVLFKMETIGSLRELYLDVVTMDYAFSNMIQSKFPFLESLVLNIKWCRGTIMNIRCVTLRSLDIQFLGEKQIEVQVHAPKLHSYGYTGFGLPSLFFTNIVPKEIKVHLMLKNPTDHLLFLKMREILKLSSKFNIIIERVLQHVRLVPFNIDDVRTMVPVPATNVEELDFLALNELMWENSILDAVFSICHPMYVKSDYKARFKVANYFSKLIFKGVVENCEIRNPIDGRWVTLTSSSLSLLDRTTPCVLSFKLSWHQSP